MIWDKSNTFHIQYLVIIVNYSNKNSNNNTNIIVSDAHTTPQHISLHQSHCPCTGHFAVLNLPQSNPCRHLVQHNHVNYKSVSSYFAYKCLETQHVKCFVKTCVSKWYYYMFQWWSFTRLAGKYCDIWNRSYWQHTATGRSTEKSC
jgi:hypothetical protein